jgi:hypothetical protein
MKCKYWKVCELYNKESATCNKLNGIYYDIDSPAGCYRKMVDKEIEIKEKRLEKKLKSSN